MIESFGKTYESFGNFWKFFDVFHAKSSLLIEKSTFHIFPLSKFQRG